MRPRPFVVPAMRGKGLVCIAFDEMSSRNVSHSENETYRSRYTVSTTRAKTKLGNINCSEKSIVESVYPILCGGETDLLVSVRIC